MPARPGMPEHGDIGDRLRRLENAVSDMQLARRLESATIGAGNLTFDGGQAVWIDSSGNTLFTIDENGLITFEADGSQLSVLDGSKLRFNRSDGTRILEITPGGGMKVYEANGTTVLTTVDGSGVQVGTDVVIDSTGLTVIGGLVTPSWHFRDDDSAQNVSLTTTLTAHVSVVVTPPAWVQQLNVRTSLAFQMTASANQNMSFRIDANGSPGSGFFNHTIVSGATQHVTRVRSFAITSFPATINGMVGVNSGTNSSNVLRLDVDAVGVRL